MTEVGPKPTPEIELRGWDIIRQFLDPSELETIVAGMDHVLAAPRPSCMDRPGNSLVPLRWNDTVVASILG